MDMSGVTGYRRSQAWGFTVRVWGDYLWGTGRGMLGMLPRKDYWICKRTF